MPAARAVPGNCTLTPATEVAVPIPGQADAAPPPTGSVGKLVVVTVQFEAVEDIVQSRGNTKTTFVWVVKVDLRQAVPLIAAPVACLSNLTKLSVTAALTFPGNKKG
ncbi:MAG: hypothetical protein UR81_C0031G0001 [Candidatus Levybacteria bacterium GW2011_GWB1_35_5]|nr:MAG: hypothetical protein UR81_C0031G0001 [Candidatus Levybacteria bacterium GW2011_GWB1_35_5]